MAKNFVLLFVFLLGAFSSLANEYIIKPNGYFKNYNINKINDENSKYSLVDTIPGLNLIKVNVDINSKSDDPRKVLTNFYNAEYVVENVTMYAFFDALDPRSAEQWALEKVKAQEAWQISQGSSSVVVAVIDTGISQNHEDLIGNLWTNTKEIPANGIDDDRNGFVDDVHGWDFHGNDKDPNDETGARNPGHGTHCAGIIGATCGNSIGVCGISPKVSLMALRFLGADGSGDLFASVKAIDYAINNGAHVISASWGATVPQSSAQPIIDAIKKAEDKGVIFVAAAANDGKSNDTSSVYPANAQTPHMISVAASNVSDQKPQWSNYGRRVDLASPGENILSTIPGGYKNLSGTSMATPLVAGIVALLKSIDSSLSGAVVRSILQTTGTQVGIETASNRRVDAYQALKAVQSKQLTVVPAAYTLAQNGTFNFSAWGGQAPYRFSSSNPSIATITESGQLTAKAEGDVVIEVTDANNTTARSVSVKVMNAAPPSGSNCPFDDQMMCLVACFINPQLPWCGDMPELPIP